MISIIIPLYNKKKEVVKTLKSLLRQSYQDFELVIVNDGSTDGSEDVVSSFSSKFTNQNISFKVLSGVNKGAPAARNIGWRVSRGDYLLFCDADAILVDNALELMLEALQKNTEASYVYSSFFWGKKLFSSFAFSSARLKKMPYIHTVALIRREHFPESGWDETILKLQDWDLWLTMLEQGRIGYWFNQPLFRIQTGGLMSFWLPAFTYKLLPFLPAVKKYKKAVSVIKQKHQLDKIK